MIRTHNINFVSVTIYVIKLAVLAIIHLSDLALVQINNMISMILVSSVVKTVAAMQHPSYYLFTYLCYKVIFNQVNVLK